MPSEVNIPKFDYPFKRKTQNSANKEKSTQSLYEEILFKESHGQYLFNKSGLFHGGVHLRKDDFPTNDFYTKGVRALADGKLVAYRIDKEYLVNELDDGSKLKYSSSFMLLEHEMAYPAGNELKFYSLYMHMAAADAYSFNVHKLKGISAYVKDKDNNDMGIVIDTKVTLGKSLKDKTVGAKLRDKENRYEVLSYSDNHIKPPSEQIWNVHITNLIKEVETTVKGTTSNIPNIRKGISQKPEDIVSTHTIGDSIVVNAFQTVKEKSKKRYAVISVNGVDVAKTHPRATIHKSNLADTIDEVVIESPQANGLVTKHMVSLAGGGIAPIPASKDIKVKAGEVLGKIGVYDTKVNSQEEKLIHVEVFTFGDLKGFSEKAKAEYEKGTEDLSDEEKKLRPKENLLVVKKDVTRYIKENDNTKKVVRLTKDDPLREGVTSHHSNKLRDKKFSQGTILSIKPTASTKKRYEVISIDEGDSDFSDEEKTKIWSVYKGSVEEINVFKEQPLTATQLYVDVSKPLKSIKKLKDKEGVEYILIDKIASVEIYVKDKKEYKTHGITFSNFKLFKGDGSDKLGIFNEISDFYSIEDTVPKQDKEKLNELFGKILKHIKLDKDENEDKKNILEAGEFAQLSMSIKERRVAMSHVMIEHESEWEYNAEKFVPLIEYMKHNNLSDHATMLEKRLDKLLFSPKALLSGGKPPIFIHPIALVEGFVGGGDCISLKEAKEISLKISGGYEGKNPSYSSLAKNFDGAGMSWGIIQWNFGQDTLGPLLRKMRQKDISKFNNCFENQTDLTTLNQALNGSSTQQFNWSIDMQNNHNQRWKNIFNNLSNVLEFQKIQLQAVEEYDTSALNSINWMKSQKAILMTQVELVTFVALHDLAVQQGGLNKGKTKVNIIAKVKEKNPTTQKEFLEIVVKERGNLAGSRWRADCISRRMGILNKKKTKITHSNITTERDNKNFKLIKEGFICDL